MKYEEFTSEVSENLQVRYIRKFTSEVWGNLLVKY